MLEVGYLCVTFSCLDVTDESQGDGFLSAQDAKQAVDQHELRMH